MKKLAIFSKGNPVGSKELTNVLNTGTRYRIITHFIISDGEIAAEENIPGDDIELFPVNVADCVNDISMLARLLDERKVDLILLDGADKELITTLLPDYEGRIIDLSEMDTDPVAPDYTRGVLALLEQNDLKDADRRWADVLGLDYDPDKASSTPIPPVPPIPGSDAPTPGLPPIPDVSQPQPCTPPASKPAPSSPAPSPFTADRSANPYHNVKPAAGPEETMPDTFLVWSVLATVFCCLIPGIVAIVYSSMVSSRYYAGDFDGARRASRMAEIWIIVSIVLGVITAAVYFPIMLFT